MRSHFSEDYYRERREHRHQMSQQIYQRKAESGYRWMNRRRDHVAEDTERACSVRSEHHRRPQLKHTYCRTGPPVSSSTAVSMRVVPSHFLHRMVCLIGIFQGYDGPDRRPIGDISRVHKALVGFPEDALCVKRKLFGSWNRDRLNDVLILLRLRLPSELHPSCEDPQSHRVQRLSLHSKTL